MASNEKIFTIDELLYYTKIAINLYCNKDTYSQILHSLSNELVELKLISQEAMTKALERNEIHTENRECEICKISKPYDPFLTCPSCKKIVHSMCFWKPGAFCNKICMKRNS